MIVGGGIGGLSAAIALQRAGFAVTVFEESPGLYEVGAGVGLQLGAVKALKRMGMLEVILDAGSEPLEALELTNWRTGKLLAKMPQGEVGADHGLFGINIHRGDLLAALATAAGDVVELNSRLAGFEQDDDGVTVRFEDGREERGAVLVGADGLHSTVRAKLHKSIELRYSGYTVWRSMPSFPGHGISDRYPQQAVGPGGGFGLHPEGERVYWFGSMVRPEGQVDSPAGRKQDVLDAFKGWYSPIPELIEATPDKEISRRDIFDLKPLEFWGTGRVTLLGDAAHATTPAMGQGAGMAIEDGVVLAEELSLDPSLRHGSRIATALKAYEGRRLPRCKAIVDESYQLSKTYNWTHPAAVRLREVVLRARPAKSWAKKFRAEVERDL